MTSPGLLRLANGRVIDVACAAGALNFHGKGWWFEVWARWLGLLRPTDFTIITKTLTNLPIRGNLTLLRPWRAVRLLPGGSTVNCVGLTNKGIDWWIARCWPRMAGKFRTIVSVMPRSWVEAADMGGALDRLDVDGIELNHCPNVAHSVGDPVDRSVDLFHTLQRQTRHPVGVKLGWQDPFVEVCRRLDGQAAWFDLINAVPWDMVFPGQRSPLEQYGYQGSVSGPVIQKFARDALWRASSLNLRTPIVSGGGVDSVDEALLRYKMGASTVTFGSHTFLHHVTKANPMLTELRRKLDEFYPERHPCTSTFPAPATSTSTSVEGPSPGG